MRWVTAHKGLTGRQIDELQAFRAEAEALLHKVPSPG
jgi:hypothetical protein